MIARERDFMKLVKKKVSFDMDAKVLSDVQSFCKENNRKVADFYRNAVNEKLEREKKHITIYVAQPKGFIEKFSVNKEDIDIEFFEPTYNMKVNVNAAKQGIIRISEDDDLNPDLKSCAVDDKIYFFTKEEYI
jgi:hypothetical protein